MLISFQRAENTKIQRKLLYREYVITVIIKLILYNEHD